MSKRALWFLLPVFIAAVAVGAVAFGAIMHRSPIAAIVQAAIPSPASVFGKNSLRILVVGLDYDYTSNDQEYSTHSRSDIIMAIHLDLARRRVYVLSVPRDMVATMPGGQQAKINEAQSEGGIGESQAVVARWLGIPGFDRYVVLRIDTMKDLINAIGGVNVDVMNSDALKHTGPNGPINYDDSWGHLHVHLNPGLQHLDGDQAVGYARFRHDWCSDPCRIMRQQQMIRAIIARLKGNGLNTMLHIAPLIAVVNKDVQTNLTPREEISLAYAFRGLNQNRIREAQVPYVSNVYLPGYGDSILPDENAKARLVSQMLIEKPAASEVSAR